MNPDRHIRKASHLPGFRSRFELSLVVTVLAALPLMMFNPPWVILPLSIFGLLCLTGPFVQRFSYFLPILRRGNSRTTAVSITFDDGPDPATTPRLLELLARFNVNATFFVIGRKAAMSPDLILKILAAGHGVGNHSDSHDVFLMLRGRKKIENEISRCQETLASFGIRPKVFRPPVGITNPHLRPILERLGMVCVGFSCRPADFGNRRFAGMKARVLKKISPGDILLLHDCQPHGELTVDQWLEQVDGILSGLREKKLQVMPLSDLIKRPVMERLEGSQ
ncbi:polysaccharide deacetylase family protein [bacterium]|nr:polysaccharide deacetylase family protein [bacterium]